MEDTGREINEISGADALGFPFDLHNGFSFQHQKGLLGPGMGVRFGLSAIFNFSEDHLRAIRAEGADCESWNDRVARKKEDRQDG